MAARFNNMDFTNSLSTAREKLGITYELKPQQVEALRHLYNGFDCVCVFPTGFGKSVVFQLLPFLRKGDAGIVLVISPLTSLMHDQVMSLCERNVKACFLNCDGTTGKTYNIVGGDRGDHGDSDEDVPFEQDVFAPVSIKISVLKKGAINIIYAHPEAVLNNQVIAKMIRSPVYKKNVCGVVIDEVHMVSEWGVEFRKAFKKLAELTCIFPQPDAVHLAVTATATPAAVNELIRDLQFSNVQTVTVNPDRPNIYIEIKSRLPNIRKFEKFDDLLEPIANELKEKVSEFPVTIVYGNQLDALGYCYQYMDDFLKDLAYSPITTQIPENRLFSQFHKDYTSKMKDHIVQQLRMQQPKLRLVFATVALGMGLNAPSVLRIIHFQPPTTMEKYMQEIGRAGRRGQPAEALLYFNKNDIASNRKGLSEHVVLYCTNTSSCLRHQIVKYFGFDNVLYSGTPNHFCSNCKYQHS